MEGSPARERWPPRAMRARPPWEGVVCVTLLRAAATAGGAGAWGCLIRAPYPARLSPLDFLSRGGPMLCRGFWVWVRVLAPPPGPRFVWVPGLGAPRLWGRGVGTVTGRQTAPRPHTTRTHARTHTHTHTHTHMDTRTRTFGHTAHDGHSWRSRFPGVWVTGAGFLGTWIRSTGRFRFAMGRQGPWRDGRRRDLVCVHTHTHTNRPLTWTGTGWSGGSNTAYGCS